MASWGFKEALGSEVVTVERVVQVSRCKMSLVCLKTILSPFWSHVGRFYVGAGKGTSGRGESDGTRDHTRTGDKVVRI